ncbi:hypothetical protein N7533_006508 [Penicillium manginii]|uniref:uncharacterized protein n=1 Tax=Penicillium manginii TaxID=203109 RepID=UPI0025487C34|nr:uncharacterized protein N7533_006508 [Penicillium manginii]KAJ5749480.1 hypothetical protein N7533_006508 [Penicillium manginii]
MSSNGQNVRDFALGVSIGIFGFSYFLIYALQFFIFHFPSTPGEIIIALSVTGFGIGIALWYLNLIYHHMIKVFEYEDITDEQDSPHLGRLFLLWVVTLPTIPFLFSGQPLLQIWYTSSLTGITVGNLPRYLLLGQTDDDDAPLTDFSLHMTSVSLVASMPTIHALAKPIFTQHQLQLAISFGELMIGGLLGRTLYLLRPLERMGVAQNWHPSLHGMHLIWTYNLVSFSNAVLQTAIHH